VHTHVNCNIIHSSQAVELACVPQTHKYTMEYNSATNKNEIMPFVGKWVELEIIMFNEISQTLKDKYCKFTPICEI
jgi:hypothetical protein